MNVSIELTKDLLRFMDKKVGKEYVSRSEIARDAIRRMMAEELREKAIIKNISLEQLDKTRAEVGKDLLNGKYKKYA